jgi:hypothetical protein
MERREERAALEVSLPDAEILIDRSADGNVEGPGKPFFDIKVTLSEKLELASRFTHGFSGFT